MNDRRRKRNNPSGRGRGTKRNQGKGHSQPKPYPQQGRNQDQKRTLPHEYLPLVSAIILALGSIVGALLAPSPVTINIHDPAPGPIIQNDTTRLPQPSPTPAPDSAASLEPGIPDTAGRTSTSTTKNIGTFFFFIVTVIVGFSAILLGDILRRVGIGKKTWIVGQGYFKPGKIGKPKHLEISLGIFLMILGIAAPVYVIVMLLAQTSSPDPGLLLYLISLTFGVIMFVGYLRFKKNPVVRNRKETSWMTRLVGLLIIAVTVGLMVVEFS